jgi:AcrR family transcriptional regulator
MTPASDAGTDPRTPLTRERILQAAIELADRDGIDALSMRKLGKALGVEAMSLYHHVANKGDLLDGITDAVVTEIALPEADDRAWRSAMRQRAINAREVLQKHPWAVALMESRPNLGPARLRYFEWMIATLRRGGFTIDLAHRALLTLDSHVYGFLIQELSWSIESGDEMSARSEEIERDYPADRYPYMIEMAADRAEKRSVGDQSDFEFGLDLILDGLERIKGGG